jgi:hypothetical protein
MRKLALAIGTLLVLMAASFVTPVGAMAASSSHSPRVAGPQSGARSTLHAPSKVPSTRAPSISIAAPLTCDGGFDAVASPNLGDSNYLVATSAVSPNDVWAVGNTFSPTVGVYDRALVEHWDGTSWTIVPTYNPTSFNEDLTGVVAVSTNDVWVVGIYTSDASGSSVTAYAQHWNGTIWNAGYNFSPSSFSFLFAVTATSSTDVWAVGAYVSGSTVFTMIEHWNGSAWSLIGSPSPSTFDNELFGVSAWSPTDIWAVGEQTSANGQPFQSLAEHWNGTSWSLIATPNTTGDNQVLWVAALESGHAVGVGYGNFVSGSAPRQSESWDLLTPGASTNNVSLGTGLGTGDNALIGVARSGAGVWAVGFSRSTLANPRQTLVIPATWDSAGHTLTWDPVGTSANPSAINSVLEAVTAVSPYSFWATGYQSGASLDQTLTESYCARHFGLTAPASTTANSPFSVTVTALNGDGSTGTGYRGTVHFTSSDGSATLPANYTFIAGDNGAHTFTGVVLATPGSRTITVADIAMPFTTPGSATVRVLCVGTCPAPSGTAGSRNTGQSSTRIAGGRTGVSQSGSGVPGPRLPAAAHQVQTSGSASATGSGTSTGSESNVAAAAPAAASTSTSPGSAAPVAGAADTAPSTTSVKAPAHRVVSLVAQSDPVSRSPDPIRRNVLLLISLVVSTLALLALRRRRIKEKSNARI